MGPLTDVQPLGGPRGGGVDDGDHALERDRRAVHRALPVAVHRQEGAVLAAALHKLQGDERMKWFSFVVMQSMQSSRSPPFARKGQFLQLPSTYCGVMNA